MSIPFILKLVTWSRLENDVMKACDMVPKQGILYICEAFILEVPANPPKNAYELADKPPSGP